MSYFDRKCAAQARTLAPEERQQFIAKCKTPQIVFTIPHAVTENFAREVAARTAQKLGELGLPPPIVLPSFTNRHTIVDMNRRASRGTPFRERIDHRIDTERVLLFDVHAYPPTTEDWGRYDVVVFNVLFTPKDDALAGAVAQGFRRASLHPGGVFGAAANDIVWTVTAPDDDAVLVEFNERLTPEVAATAFTRAIRGLL